MISISMIFRLAILTLMENRLRSILTLIGMVFGNAAVIATLSSNEGAKVYIAKQLSALGNKLMTVELISGKFTDFDSEKVLVHVDNIDYAAVERLSGEGNLSYGDQTYGAKIMGVSNDYFRVSGLRLGSGRFLTPEESASSDPVAVLGANIRKNLFRDFSFSNEYIVLTLGQNKLLLKVVGSAKEKGGSSSILDNSIYLPPALVSKLGDNHQDRLLVLLKDDNQSTSVKYQLTALLSSKFGNAVRISDAREAIERTQAIWSKQNFLGICLAVISLLTGGIGIMNIMLLSIHQRQKEIGLRKAVGARNSEIAAQFLFETVIICVMGSLLGILVGWAFGNQVAKMLGEWDAAMSWGSVVLAVIFSVITGIVFGATPAMRAAKIDPYDALRTG